MYKAIQELEIIPDFIIIDAVKLESLKIPNISLIKGDQRCLSVAAASIVAKISRDRMMRDIYEVKFPNYGFASNKGYGSKQHLESLNVFGPSKIHRMSFKPLSEINRIISNK
jgi:ribonuclease HII